jgi:hypothetical protein
MLQQTVLVEAGKREDRKLRKYFLTIEKEFKMYRVKKHIGKI